MSELQRVAYYTAEQIAAMARISPRAVNKRLENTAYHIGNTTTNGRPMKLYKREAVHLWVKEQDANSMKLRKKRSDSGKRKVDAEMLEWLTSLVLMEYLAVGTRDVRSACRRALNRAAEMVQAGVKPFALADIQECAHNEWLYFKHVNRKDKYGVGPAHVQGWADLHSSKWALHRDALSQPTVRYSFYEIAETLGCREGWGYASYIMLDDRKADAWTLEDGTQAMVKAVYAWDILTGVLLWVEPCKEVNAHTYLRCITNTIAAHGLHCPVWFMENSRAALANDIEGIVKTLYSEEDKAFFYSAEYQLLFNANSSPIVRNSPHIPKGIGKAIGERRFKEIKRGDAYCFPQSYHGAGIHEAVQLQRNNMPKLGSYTPTRSEYFDAIYNYAYTEYLDVKRDNLIAWAKDKGRDNTYRAMMEYYKPSEVRKPSPEQMATMLYYVLPSHEVKMRELGALRVQMGHKVHNLRSELLYEYSYKGQVFRIIQNPFDDTLFMIYRNMGAKSLPVFVCMAKDFTVRSAQDSYMVEQSREMRERHKQRRALEIEQYGMVAGVHADTIVVQRTQQMSELEGLPLSPFMLEENTVTVNATMPETAVDEDYTRKHHFIDPDLF